MFNIEKKMSEKDRIVIHHMIGAFVIKGLALVISLLSTPAYIRFFQNQTALGLWFTINSVLAWVLNFDLGIGNGLRNHLAKTYTEKNEVESKKYISSAYISIGLLCALIAGCFIVIFDKIDWNRIFNINEDIVSSSALLLSVKIVFIGILLQLFFKLINSILYAIQKSSINNFLSLCTSVITLVCLYVLPSGDNNTNIVLMAVVHLLSVLLPLFVATIIVFSKTELKNCIPRIRYFSVIHMREVLFLGGTFLFIQILYMVIMSTNEYLISFFCSSDDVVIYQLYNKPFSLCGTIFSLALTPVWSAVTKSFSEKDFKWINKLYKKLMTLSMLGIVISFAVIPFVQTFMDIWLGKDFLIIDNWFAIAFAALSSTMILNSVLSSFANGIGKLKVQTISFMIGALVKIPVAFLLVTIMHSWIGVVWANVISMSIYCFVQPAFLKKEMNRKMTIYN